MRCCNPLFAHSIIAVTYVPSPVTHFVKPHRLRRATAYRRTRHSVARSLKHTAALAKAALFVGEVVRLAACRMSNRDNRRARSDPDFAR